MSAGGGDGGGGGGVKVIHTSLSPRLEVSGQSLIPKEVEKNGQSRGAQEHQ